MDNFYTSYSQPSISSSTEQFSNLDTSPTAEVNAYNQNNGTWFLTCPAKPEQNPTDQEYFYTGSVPYVAGAACFLTPSETSLYTQTTLPTQITWSEYSLASASVEPMQVQNGAEAPNINLLAYSPMVNGEISSNFQTNSYLFQQIPAYAQNAIWTWHADFADFSNMQVPASSSWSSTLSYTYINGANVCTYSYNYSENTLLTSASNYYIPFNEVLPNGQYNTFDANAVPYLLYNFSMPSINPGLTRSAPMLNLSYDTLGPWNYYTPQNSIDMFPIDVGSRLFVNYNGVLQSTSQTCLISLGVGNGGSINICPPLGSMNNGNINNFISIPGWESAQISGPLAVAALPNDYIYVLNYSSSADEYYINVLRLVPHGYYNTSNYQPSSIGSTTSSSAWVSEWDNYWSNIIDMQNQSVYLVQSIGLNNIANQVESANGGIYSGYAPIGIAVDYNGDVFITGSTLNTSAGATETVLAEVTNTTTGPIHTNATVINPKLPVESEIAVSPTGGIVFLANKTSGYIQTFSGTNFTQIGSIDLSYNKYIGGERVAELNISSYLANGGLYNQSMSWIPQIFNSWNLNPNFETDSVVYHHPLAIQDINGYLYVLDQWTGGLGVVGPTAPSFFSLNYYDKGVFFNILMLRVMNDTGYDVPINPTNFNDMVQQVSCTTPASIQNACIISQAGANSACSAINQECTAQPVSSCVTAPTAGSSFICTGTYTVSTKPPIRYQCAPQTPTAIEACNSGYTLAQANAQCQKIAPTCSAQTQNICYTPGSTYECVGPSKTAKTFYATSALNLSGEYPPYGWVLSANVTAAEFSCSKLNIFGSDFCGSSARYLADSPYSETFSIENQPSNYYGGFPPIGPPLTFANRTNEDYYNLANVTIQWGYQPSGHLRFDYSYLLSGIGFSANYNSTIYTLIPSTSAYSQNSLRKNGGSDSGLYPFLVTTKLPVENYTKLFGGFSPFSCYLVNGYGNRCKAMPALQYMSRPIFSVTDPFKYLESIGSPSWILTFSGLLYSSPTSTGGISASGECSATKITSCSQCSSSTNNCAICQVCNLEENAYNSLNPNIIFSGPTPFINPQSSLTSKISGYLVVPYTYNVIETQSWTNFQQTSGPGAPNCTTPPDQQSSTDTTYYSSAIGQSSQSNLLTAPLEGGYSYAQYNGGPSYYIPNLSDIGLIIPPQVAFNIENNRIFGSVYVNMSSPAFSNIQYVTNATHVFNYSVTSNIFTMPNGAKFGYDYISTMLPNQIYGANAYTADTHGSTFVTDHSALYNGSQIMPFILSYTLQQNIMPTFVSLFDWYKAIAYTNPLILNINASTVNTYNYQAGPESALGYNRLIYVFNDRFNNTFYMPIDADIANITTLDMSATPNVSITNANSTMITITGRAYYNLLYGLKTVPLQNAPIYLYYGKDINYNKTLSANEISLCAYSPNSIGTSNCTLANPMWKGLTNNADTITYAPAYNSSGECPMPPKSLIAPVNSVYTMCNIYGVDNIQQSCPNSALGNTQYCIPLYSNGTGICTPQLGLMGIATTNSLGYFTFNTVACGIEQGVPIIAKFYGEPIEPITVTQPGLALSANTLTIASQSLPREFTFTAINYTWSPNETATSVDIGLAELSFGNLDALIGIALVAGLLAVAAIARKIRQKR
ncbi:MAG: hypothetical protein QXL63_02510 [Candidatus Micrarchaeaceae archaeon]